MDRFQLRIVCELYGLAQTVAGRNPDWPVYSLLLTREQRHRAKKQLAEISSWLKPNLYRGDMTVSAMNQNLSAQHDALYEGMAIVADEAAERPRVTPSEGTSCSEPVARGDTDHATEEML